MHQSSATRPERLAQSGGGSCGETHTLSVRCNCVLVCAITHTAHGGYGQRKIVISFFLKSPVHKGLVGKYLVYRLSRFC